ILFVFVSYRAVVTLSRGGVITAILCIAIFLIMYFFQAKPKVRNQVMGAFVLFLGGMAMAWVISSNQSSGMGDRGYANQNARGVEKEDITTGRKQLFMEEIEGFISNPFFGIGSSRAKDQRIEVDGEGVTSHNELSRTLAEHGIFGIIILIILL